ncbi:hypothetical protein ASC77_19635 [Nocardioides sp. Root1257]|uniref:AMP-binding protein n=1 Tax=unclassified Nocardioides TaxID=2615069 RepID=UPI000700594A|nr:MULTISPECIES: AMP-binding protein [unclassified Nocardioides]KQW44999.1 hypothetical protein ASC77_19635 [Nocardioides sp. Root1257]KRC45997.1 hypothetical protein ASE24_15585 [Nocardioides sp. Root224]
MSHATTTLPNSRTDERFTEAAGHAPSSLPQLVRRNAAEFGDRVAYRTPASQGRWDSMTWAQVYAVVVEAAAGILELERKLPARQAGQAGFVVGPNSPEHFIAEYALQAVGLTAFPLFSAISTPEMRVTLESYPVSIAFSGSSEATGRLLEATDTLSVERIVQWGTEPIVEDPRVLTFSELRRMGAELLKRRPDAVDELIDAGTLEDIACVILTSGTTGVSKGVLGSNAYMLDVAARYRFVYDAQPFARYLSYLPAAFSVEQYNGLTLAAAVPLDVAFSSSPAAADAEFVTSEATMKYLGPRQWEELRATLPQELLSNPDEIVRRRDEIRRTLGLEHVTGCVTAGGSLGPEVLEFFAQLGLRIRNVYGFAEVGIITSTRDGDPSESVGAPIPSLYGAEQTQLRITEIGEVQVLAGVRCAGYWGDKNKLDLTDDGWLRSGDAGVIENGALHILDRITNIQHLPNGTTFAPQPIEIAAMSSPYFSNFVLIGGHGEDSRIGALVQLNEDAVQRQQSSSDNPSSYQEMVVDQRIEALVVAEVQKLNQTLPSSQRIALVGVLPKPLTVDDGELTRSLKLRRAVVVDRYDELVDAMYERSEAGPVAFSAYVGRDGEGASRNLEGYVNQIRQH